jgi:hypothetical protein
VIWGQFPDGQVENKNVTYIDGEHLVSWLMSRPARPQRIPE